MIAVAPPAGQQASLFSEQPSSCLPTLSLTAYDTEDLAPSILIRFSIRQD